MRVDLLDRVEQLERRIMRLEPPGRLDMLRLTGIERRILIIEAARRFMCEHGADRLTFKGVALACAVPTSHATVKHYFPSREHLLRAIER